MHHLGPGLRRCRSVIVTTLPRESDVLSSWRGRQAPRFESSRITVRLRIMAKRSWPELTRNAALLGLMQPNLETGARRTGRNTLFGLAGGNFSEIGCCVWNLLAFARRGSVGRSSAFPSFIVFSTRWKESRLNGVLTGRRKQSGYELKVRELFESIFRVIMFFFFLASWIRIHVIKFAQ